MRADHVIKSNHPGRRRRALCLPAACLCLFLLLAAGCGNEAAREPAGPAGGFTAREVLERTVDDLMSLDSYRYRGTSSISIEGMSYLDSESEFDTVLVRNEQGAMDGHMVVTSDRPGGSYETYAWRGTEYTRPEGGDWYRVDRGGEGEGYGLVSENARRILADFAELAEEVSMVEEDGSRYVISLVMGPRYFQGAAEAAENASEVTMTITVDKRTLRMLSATMTSSTPAGADMPGVTTTSEGSYSEFNDRFDVEPPPEALDAPRRDTADTVM